jgi:hypothetical protein
MSGHLSVRVNRPRSKLPRRQGAHGKGQQLLYSSSVTCSPIRLGSLVARDSLGDGQVGQEMIGCGAVPGPLVGGGTSDTGQPDRRPTPLHLPHRQTRITSTVAFESIRDDAQYLSVRAKAGPALVTGARAAA